MSGNQRAETPHLFSHTYSETAEYSGVMEEEVGVMQNGVMFGSGHNINKFGCSLI